MSDRTYILIDGENLLLRYQAMVARGCVPSNWVNHSQDRYVWHSGIARDLKSPVARVSYYTTFVGDDPAIESLAKEISDIEYRYGPTSKLEGSGTLNPHVFKKLKQGQGTKSVDINICVDALRHTSAEGLVTVVLVTGDGDYLPLIQELMRKGVNVEVQSLSDGCNPKLYHVPDFYYQLDGHFFSSIK